MRKLAIVLLSLAIVATWATPTAAEAAWAPFTFVNAFDTLLDPGTQQVTPGGVLVVRGQVLSGTQTTTIDGEDDFTGVATLTLNLNLDLKNGQGSLFGTYELDGGLDTWSGTFRGVFDPATGLSTGTFVGQGEISTQRGAFTQTGPSTFEGGGTILLPDRP